MSIIPTYSLPYRWGRPCGWLLGALILTGCAGHQQTTARGAGAYVVHFTVSRTSDHAVVSSAAVPVMLGGEGKVKRASQPPLGNQPVATEFLVRLARPLPSGAYEMVTRVAIKEANRNKKGKLKTNQCYLGALVPTRLGEIQIVSAESDPIHVEARLERR